MPRSGKSPPPDFTAWKRRRSHRADSCAQRPSSEGARADSEPQVSAAHASRVRNMQGIVLRVRLISGDNVDVTYEEPNAVSEDEVIDHVVTALAEGPGVLRCRHGDRLLVLYARGVAAVEVAPRGAVL
jgi:hypothetical protein